MRHKRNEFNPSPGPLSVTQNPKVKIKLQKSVGDLIKEMDNPTASSRESHESYRRSFSRLKTISFSSKMELSLPETFNRSSIQMQVSDECGLCEQPFGKTPMLNCVRCGVATCETCSDSNRRLSHKDPTKYRVCDKCDTIMDNYKIVRHQNELCMEQINQIDALQKSIQNINDERFVCEVTQAAEVDLLKAQVYKQRDQVNSLATLEAST